LGALQDHPTFLDSALPEFRETVPLRGASVNHFPRDLGGCARLVFRRRRELMGELSQAGAAERVNNLTFGTSAFGTISATRLTPREAQIGVRFLF
jgi:hypothetical protein